MRLPVVQAVRVRNFVMLVVRVGFVMNLRNGSSNIKCINTSYINEL